MTLSQQTLGQEKFEVDLDFIGTKSIIGFAWGSDCLQFILLVNFVMFVRRKICLVLLP